FFRLYQMDQPARGGVLRFYREWSTAGLSGVSDIELGEQGIVREKVAYDLNLASDMLRRAVQRRHDGLSSYSNVGAYSREDSCAVALPMTTQLLTNAAMI